MRIRGERCQVQQVVDDQENRNDERLGHFYTVDTGQDVDAVGAEGGDRGHVSIIKPAKFDEFSKVPLQRNRDHYLGDAKVDEVYDQERNRRNCWNEDFMSPSYVE